MGRAGRGGEPSICVFLHQKNQRLPKEMRPFFKAGSVSCQRKALTKIFSLSDTDGDIFFLHEGVSFNCPIQLSMPLKRWGWSAARLAWNRVAAPAASASIFVWSFRPKNVFSSQLLHELYCYLHLLSLGDQAGCWQDGEGHLGFGWSRVQVCIFCWMFSHTS